MKSPVWRILSAWFEYVPLRKIVLDAAGIAPEILQNLAHGNG